MPNPLILPVARAALPAHLAALAERAERDRGEATFLEVMAHAPELVEWYYDSFYRRVFYGGRVERRIKELLRLKLSTLHGCAFCNRGNTLAAREAGVSEAQIESLRDPASACFSERERSVLLLAEQMALQNMDGAITPALHAMLARHFGPAEILELGITLAVLTGMAKFLFVYDLVSREADCPIGRPPPA
jgi:AhpD family alkylhydroperoxidase